ncbi:MAG: FHA domain-containing protein [Deltaproteobacteria bacterium]|nr:FHA domain-containing protein [Deltaproteobacteria bacterium]
MARTKALEKQAVGTFLEQLMGVGKGRVFELSETQSIGRAEDNEIVIVSQAVSRYHAGIDRTAEGFLIRDNESKNGIMINGNQVTEGVLHSGDVIQIGDFVFRFMDNSSPQADDANLARLPLGISSSTNSPIRSSSKRPLLYAGLLVFLAIAGWFYLGSESETQAPVKNEGSAGTDTSIGYGETGFKGSVGEGAESTKINPVIGAPATPRIAGLEDPTVLKEQRELERIEALGSSIREAEQYFRKGQREYLNKNYHRAIENFQACLSLFRAHELAGEYLRLAVLGAENEAKKNWEIGKKYFESLQYSRAIFHFDEVVSLLSHRPSDPLVKSAEEYKNLARRKMRAAELYP